MERLNNLDELYKEANKNDEENDRTASPYQWAHVGTIELVIHQNDAEACFHSGACDSDVDDHIDMEYLKLQFEGVTDAHLTKALHEYFFDSEYDPQCLDRENNLKRLLWLASAEIVENTH